MIEGKPLAKGIYGLHVLPAEDQWIVIFSKNSTAWAASVTIRARNALRVVVEPAAVGFP